MVEKHKKPTLKDVAELSGVSVISASRVMSGGPNISENLRRKVEVAAKSLGYQRNRIAGSLRAKTSDLVSVIVPSMSNNVFPNIIDGLSESLQDTQLRLVLGMTQYSDVKEEDILRDMLSWKPAAVVLAGLEHSAQTRALLATYNGPIIEVMDTDGEATDIAVGVSQIAAGQLIARHFTARGYRNVGYIGAWGERPVRSRKRRLAFEAELKKLGNPIKAVQICEEASSLMVGAHEMERLLAQNRKLDAVFFANDDLAMGALLYCQKKKIAVPQDVAIAGFNGMEMAQMISPCLTTLRTPRYDMGRIAGEMLCQRIAGTLERKQFIHELPIELLLGETS
jgi:LacI family gluconate utilization system Gnt-I transcriptional repressor